MVLQVDKFSSWLVLAVLELLERAVYNSWFLHSVVEQNISRSVFYCRAKVQEHRMKTLTQPQTQGAELVRPSVSGWSCLLLLLVPFNKDYYPNCVMMIARCLATHHVDGWRSSHMLTELRHS
jgi:hypothetical protein